METHDRPRLPWIIEYELRTACRAVKNTAKFFEFTKGNRLRATFSVVCELAAAYYAAFGADFVEAVWEKIVIGGLPILFILVVNLIASPSLKAWKDKEKIAVLKRKLRPGDVFIEDARKTFARLTENRKLFGVPSKPHLSPTVAEIMKENVRRESLAYMLENGFITTGIWDEFAGNDKSRGIIQAPNRDVGDNYFVILTDAGLEWGRRGFPVLATPISH